MVLFTTCVLALVCVCVPVCLCWHWSALIYPRYPFNLDVFVLLLCVAWLCDYHCRPVFHSHYCFVCKSILFSICLGVFLDPMCHFRYQLSLHRGRILREEGVTEETVASFGITGGGSMHYEARFEAS